MFVVHTGNISLDKAARIALGDLFSNIQNFRITVDEPASVASPAGKDFYGTWTQETALGHWEGGSKPVILAGLDYYRPWTRDAAINCWNGASFVIPEIARNTLLAVLTKEEGMLRIGGQYWDAMVWATGAWHHYLCTGDESFLKMAHEATVNSLRYFEETEFNADYNLFRGLGWSDGVSAYEGKYANTQGSGAAHSWPKYNPDKASRLGFGIPMMATSTNCLYYNAYEVASKMENQLGLNSLDDWAAKAGKLKAAINSHLWNEDSGVYKFYIDEDEECHLQETIGNAYAILFGIADQQKSASIFKNQHVSPAGVPCGWPPLERYHMDGESFARHNAVVWPQIQGFWGQAAASHKKEKMLFHEISTLAEHAVRDMQFAEIYHPYTGEKYGGMQENHKGQITQWQATNRQTWSATAYIRMILYGLLGINIDENGMGFSPCIPRELDKITLSGLKFRSMVLNVTVSGSGSQIVGVFINGQVMDRPVVPNSATGAQSVEITLG